MCSFLGLRFLPVHICLHVCDELRMEGTEMVVNRKSLKAESFLQLTDSAGRNAIRLMIPSCLWEAKLKVR